MLIELPCMEWTCEKCGNVNCSSRITDPFPFCEKCGHQIWLGNVQPVDAPPAAPPPDALARYDARRIVETFDALFDATDVYDFQQYQREMFGDNE